jgi:ankyrin repeat protein
MISQHTFALSATELSAALARAPSHAASALSAAFHLVSAHKTGELERLLDTGRPGQFDVNRRHSARGGGASLLLAAVHFGHGDIVRLLLARGASPNAHSDTGDTPLVVACRRGFVSVVDALLLHNSSNSQAERVDVNLRVRWSALEMACKHGLVALVKKLLAAGARTDVGAPLHAACATANVAGAADVVRYLIAARAHLDARVDGRTPLECAIARRAAPLVALLLDAGADCGALTASGQTLLMRAVKGGDDKTVRVILNHGAAASAAINVADENGHTALTLAVAAGSAPIVELLCKHGADANYRKPDGGLAPLYSAARRSDCAGVVEALLAGGARVNEQEADGATALTAAVSAHIWRAAELLLAHGADASLGRAEQSAPLLSHPTSEAMIDALVAAGAPVNAMSVDGRTPLFFAAVRQDVTALKALLRHGADASLGDSVLAMLLDRHWYSQSALLATVQLLIETGGAGVNAVFRATSDRAIHVALRQRADLSVVQHLLVAGADVDVPGLDGATAVQLATQADHSSWVLAARREHYTDTMRICTNRAIIRQRRLALIRRRAVQICLALRHVSALELVAVLEHDNPTLRDMPFGLKYTIVSAVKHFVPSKEPKVMAVPPKNRAADVLVDFITRHVALTAVN